MDDMNNTELGISLGYLNKQQEVTNTGMQALIVNLCASMMIEGVSAIGMLNSEIEQYYRYMDKGAVDKPFTQADLRYTVYNIVSGSFPACPDEEVYLACANGILDFMSCYREIKFSELNRDFADILITQIEQEKKYMTARCKKFEGLNNIVLKHDFISFDTIIDLNCYFDLFSTYRDEMLRYGNIYEMGYIQGKRDERARRKKAAEKGQA